MRTVILVRCLALAGLAAGAAAAEEIRVEPVSVPVALHRVSGDRAAGSRSTSRSRRPGSSRSATAGSS